MKTAAAIFRYLVVVVCLLSSVYFALSECDYARASWFAIIGYGGLIMQTLREK